MKITEINDIKEFAQLMIDQAMPGKDQYVGQLQDCIYQIDRRLSEIKLIHKQILNIQKVVSQWSDMEGRN